MSSTKTKSSLPPQILERIRKQQQENALWREKNGDPYEALTKFMRERYVLEDLLPDPVRYPHGAEPWIFDDSDDDG